MTAEKGSDATDFTIFIVCHFLALTFSILAL